MGIKSGHFFDLLFWIFGQLRHVDLVGIGLGNGLADDLGLALTALHQCCLALDGARIGLIKKRNQTRVAKSKKGGVYLERVQSGITDIVLVATQHVVDANQQAIIHDVQVDQQL